MKLLKRIKWANVILVAVIFMASALLLRNTYNQGKNSNMEQLKYSQQQQELLNGEVKKLSDENKQFRSDVFQLRHELSEAQDTIAELETEISELENK